LIQIKATGSLAGTVGHIPVTAGASQTENEIMLESLIAWLLIGAIAGWLASLIVKGVMASDWLATSLSALSAQLLPVGFCH
jgi:hypothetical protein